MCGSACVERVEPPLPTRQQRDCNPGPGYLFIFFLKPIRPEQQRPKPWINGEKGTSIIVSCGLNERPGDAWLNNRIGHGCLIHSDQKKSEIPLTAAIVSVDQVHTVELNKSGRQDTGQN